MTLSVPTRMTPSYAQGFYAPQRGCVAVYPELWRGCVGAWNPGLGPTGSTLFDWSENQNHAPATSMAPATDWIVDQRHALDFDTSWYLETQNVIPALSAATLCAWVKVSAANAVSYARIVDSIFSTGFFIGFNAGKFGGGFRTTSSPYGSYCNIADGEWAMYALTRNGAVNRAFLNGDNSTSSDNTTTTAATTPNVMRFGETVTGTSAATFELGEVRIYNRVLTPGEIKTLSLRENIAYERKRRVAYSSPAVGGSIVPRIIGHRRLLGVS